MVQSLQSLDIHSATFVVGLRTIFDNNLLPYKTTEDCKGRWLRWSIRYNSVTWLFNGNQPTFEGNQRVAIFDHKKQERYQGHKCVSCFLWFLWLIISNFVIFWLHNICFCGAKIYAPTTIQTYSYFSSCPNIVCPGIWRPVTLTFAVFWYRLFLYSEDINCIQLAPI